MRMIGCCTCLLQAGRLCPNNIYVLRTLVCSRILHDSKPADMLDILILRALHQEHFASVYSSAITVHTCALVVVVIYIYIYIYMLLLLIVHRMMIPIGVVGGYQKMVIGMIMILMKNNNKFNKISVKNNKIPMKINKK
jgi:hypothetical protein